MVSARLEIYLKGKKKKWERRMNLKSACKVVKEPVSL
jgi:hypothetical protein